MIFPSTILLIQIVSREACEITSCSLTVILLSQFILADSVNNFYRNLFASSSVGKKL